MPGDELKGFRIENVRHPAQPDLIERAVKLWLDEDVLAQAESQRRTSELLLVALSDADDAVVGVCTTYLQVQPNLRMPLWHFRTYVSAAFRENDIGFHLLIGARDFHCGQYVSGVDTRGAGLYMEVENPILQKYRNEAVWQRSGMVFVGYGQRGQHCRVHYFPGARLTG